VIGEHPRLDPLGQLHLLPGAEQRHLTDLLEVVLDRVGRSAAGGHPGGRKALIITAGNQRLILALPAHRLRQAAGSSRDVSLAGAWFLLAGGTSRTRPSFGGAAR
jgi:hypothetical protein